MYKVWSKSRTVEEKEAYRQAKVSAKRVIFEARRLRERSLESCWMTRKRKDMCLE